MASPPKALRAHDYRASLSRPLHQFRQATAEFSRLGVVGIGAKSRMLPRVVRRIGTFRTTPSTERFRPPISDAYTLKRSLKFSLVELRPAARRRIRSHVDQQRDLIRAQQSDEGLEGMRRMADGE